MIKTPIRSYLASTNLPFEIVDIKEYHDFALIYTNTHDEYFSRHATQKEYQIYQNLIHLSSSVKKAVFEAKTIEGVLLFFDYESLTEAKVKSEKTLQILREIHKKSSFEITLKKSHLVNLNNIYKVLDNKFSYLEMRIREIEMQQVKNDISWIVLAKYNSILDARLYLYDLQSDIFKAIDKNEILAYGILYKTIDDELYNKKGILPIFDVYYGPISMLYCRCYLQLDGISILEDVKRLDSFNQKYFCFMCLYILILNLNLEVVLNNYSIDNYILLTKKIRCFIASFKEILEK